METEGVRLDIRAPLEWLPMERFAAEEVAMWMRANVSLLQALASLESPVREPEAAEPRADVGLTRLEAKIDLTLVLLGELIRRHSPLPAETTVSLSSQTLSWAGSAPAPGALGLVFLYLSPQLPWPLRLPVEIIQSEANSVRARLLHLSVDTQDWLDRTLFRHHRRTLQTRSR